MHIGLLLIYSAIYFGLILMLLWLYSNQDLEYVDRF